MFRRPGLWAGGLHILLNPLEAGEKIGDGARKKMVAIELGRDLRREAQTRPRRFHRSGFRHRVQEVDGHQLGPEE